MGDSGHRTLGNQPYSLPVPPEVSSRNGRLLQRIQGMSNQKESILPPGARWPFMLLASCFLWWAIANNLTDPLVKVFKEIFGMSTFQASLIQMAFYGGYFCMALPGAMIARKFNYKTGVLLGLGAYAVGCFLLYPAMLAEQFAFFCFAFYVLACGLGILETNANPYVLVLGSEKTATRRLNFAQAFNPIGSVVGIVLCQMLVMARLPQDAEGNLAIGPAQITESLNTVIFPYLSVAAVLVAVWFLILITRMPRASEHDKNVDFFGTVGRLLRNRNYVFSVFAQFCYVGTQISVWTYTNFYIPDQIGVTQEVALRYHTAALVLFGCMRWVFTGLMTYFRGSTLLLAAAVLAIAMTLCVIFVGGMPGVIALVCISGFMSLMFPTIFGLGCSNLGEDTKLASSGQIMAIVGGAIITPMQGAIVDEWGVSLSYALPLLCFVVIGLYGLTSREHEERIHSEEATQ
jgi:MFS transporter, FHS family, L-fucose permease